MFALLRQHLEGELKRSDALRALIWPTTGLLVALMAGAAWGVRDWVLILVALLLVAFMFLYAWAYYFFATTDSDALRSEWYKLRKTEIEHGLIGDDRTGLIELKPSSMKGGGEESDIAVGEQ